MRRKVPRDGRAANTNLARATHPGICINRQFYKSQRRLLQIIPTTLFRLFPPLFAALPVSQPSSILGPCTLGVPAHVTRSGSRSYSLVSLPTRATPPPPPSHHGPLSQATHLPSDRVITHLYFLHQRRAGTDQRLAFAKNAKRSDSPMTSPSNSTITTSTIILLTSTTSPSTPLCTGQPSTTRTSVIAPPADPSLHPQPQTRSRPRSARTRPCLGDPSTRRRPATMKTSSLLGTSRTQPTVASSSRSARRTGSSSATSVVSIALDLAGSATGGLT